MKAKNLALKIILFVLTLNILLPLSLASSTQVAHAAGGPEQCIADTKNSAQAQNANVVTFCDEAYVYDIVASNAAKVPTFVSGDKNDEGGAFKLTLVNCSGFLGVNILRPDGTGVRAPEGKTCAALEGKENFGNQPGGQDFSKLCSMKVVQDCIIWDGKSELFNYSGHTLVLDGSDQGNFNIQKKGEPFVGPADEKAHTTDLDKLSKASSEADTCSSTGGALAFFFCPVLEAITSAITFLIGPGDNQGLLINLLKIPPLQRGTPSGDIVNSVLSAVINIANTFYILLFLIIILSTIVPIPALDNYTVKKALPRLITAIILTQFSFLICSLAVDIGNVLGYGVPTFLYQAVAGVLPGAPNFSTVDAIGGSLYTAIPFAAGIGFALPLFATLGIIVVVVLFIVVLFGVLVAFFWLMARYLIVYFLIFLTPLAFAAMVLPGTQKYFKMWGEDFIKVLLTFPLVTGMLAGSLIVAQILNAVLVSQQNNNSSQLGIINLMVGLIPVIALLAIPKTLKWGGKLSSAVGGAIGGYIGAKAGSAKNTAVGGAKAVGKPVIQDTRGRYAAQFGRQAQENVRQGRRRGFSGIASRVLSGNYTPGQRGQIGEAAQIEKEIGVGYDSAKGRYASFSGNTDQNAAGSRGVLAPKPPGPNQQTPAAQNRAVLDRFFQANPHVNQANYQSRYNGVVVSEAGAQYLDSVQQLLQNPNDARLVGEVKAGMEHLSNLGETDAVAISKNMMDDTGQGDLYSRISGPVTVASEKAPDAGPGGAWDTNALRPEQAISAHHSTIRRMARADVNDDVSLARVTPGFFTELNRSPNRGNIRPQTVQAFLDFANTHQHAATGTNERRVADEILANIDPATGTWI